ncbi:MAG: ribonucleotide reductase N-terminal alpha domain-containing protein, partial [Thiogranum sp.]
MTAEYFTTPLSRMIWDTRYRYRDSGIVLDKDVDASWRRVAHALATVEARAQDGWEEAFYQLLADFRFLPAGRIMAGAGSGHRVTLFNCFVMGGIEDSMEGIFTAL